MAEMENNQEEKKLDCTVHVEESGPWKKKISVSIPREEIDKELNSQYGELSLKAEVPGFRKGHAPRKLVEKRFGDDVSNQTKLRLLAQAFEKIDNEYKFEILGEPDFDPEEVKMPETGDLDFNYEIEVKPEFDLPTLEGLKVEKQLVEITDERVDETIMDLRRRRGNMEEIEKAEENDMVWADVTMKVEGVDTVESSRDTMVRCGSAALMGVLVENMADVLKDARIGESRACSAVAPDTHEKEEYRGKKVEFSLDIKNVRRLVPAEINDEFLASFGAESEDELKRMIQENLEDRVDQEIRRQMVGQIYDHLENNIKFDLPEGVAARYADRVLVRQYYELMRQGMAREQIEENMEQLRASSSERAARELKMSFIMERAADKLDIKVDEAEVNGQIAQLAIQQRRRPERLREELQREGRLEMLTAEIREQKALDKILEMAEVVDAPPTDEKKEKKKKAKKAKKTPAAAEDNAKSKSSSRSEKEDDDKKTTKKSMDKSVKKNPPPEDK